MIQRPRLQADSFPAPTMLTKRIIPCLDVKDGRTVKGILFEDLQDVGDPVTLGAKYAREGADELVYLDITATHEGRKTFVDLVARVAEGIDIPFTVGGGITCLADVEALLAAGADKVSVNSAAVRRPELIDEIARAFGNQCLVLAIDTRRLDGRDRVHVLGGREATDRTLLEWAEEAASRGAGEILLTSMDHDGTRQGFATDILSRLSQAVDVPIIASGGGGALSHFAEVLQPGVADAALAASIFHYDEIPLPRLKRYLYSQGIPIRLGLEG
jgi:imidazole glycerol-phosphate synthase subunit HisF